MRNALTIDVEDYFHVAAFRRDIRPAQWDDYPLRVIDNTWRILDWLEGYGLRATFFILGWVARRASGLVREIKGRGHEVACHGFGHQLLYEIGPERARQDIRTAKGILEDICGCAVTAYRAPTYSITNRSLWAFDILIEEGFTCDSSLYPIRHDLYGIPGGRRFPHIIRRPSGSIREFPISTLRLRGVGRHWHLPVGGGGYLRLLPAPLIVHAFRHINEKEGAPALLYFHPWEIDPDQPRVRTGWKSRFRHYHNLEKTFDKLDYLVQRLHFAPLREVLATVDWESAAIEDMVAEENADSWMPVTTIMAEKRQETP
jgi:polysaccharide deacetylase family protein (PEP-CTERM system associated)